MSKAATDTLEKVSSEFEAEVLAALEEGREEANSKLDTAKGETAEAVSKTLEIGAKQAESIRRQVIGTAELEVRNVQLRSLEVAMTDVFDAATKKVSQSSGTSYEEALARLIKEGVDILGPRAKVLCAAKDKRSVSAALEKLGGKKDGLSVESLSIETMGGVVLTSDDGSVRFDNTFEARLERMRPSLRKEVAALLTRP